MTITNEYERDLNDTAFLKRPGRVDLRVFQNTPDCGDGHPGLQRCFRNYLHEGGMEKDLDLVGYGIKGTSVDINNVELQQLSNIGATTINGTQWGYVGGADQPLKKADSVIFGGITVNGNITITGTVDGIDISTHVNQDIRNSASPTFVGLILSADLVTTSTIDGVDVSSFKTDYDAKINQDLRTTASPTFVGLTLSADLITSSTVDGVDVSAIKLNSMPSAADDDIDANTQKIVNVVDPTDPQDVATKIYTDLITNVVVSDNLLHQNDTERIGYESSYTKIKEITVNIRGNIRVTWGHHRDTQSSIAYSKVYVNDIAVGPEESVNTEAYQYETYDVEDLVPGDKIQIWYRKGTSIYINVKDMRLSWDWCVNTGSY